MDHYGQFTEWGLGGQWLVLLGTRFALGRVLAAGSNPWGVSFPYLYFGRCRKKETRDLYGSSSLFYGEFQKSC